MRWSLVAWGTLAAVLLVFFMQNYEVVTVRFLFWHLDMSRAVLLLLVLAIGVAIGWALAALARSRRDAGPGS